MPPGVLAEGARDILIRRLALSKITLNYTNFGEHQVTLLVSGDVFAAARASPVYSLARPADLPGDRVSAGRRLLGNGDDFRRPGVHRGPTS